MQEMFIKIVLLNIKKCTSSQKEKKHNQIKEAIEFKMHIFKMCQMYHSHQGFSRVFCSK